MDPVEEYRDFFMATAFPWCWYCGRDQFDAPEGWYAPWLIERAHVVSSPRRIDRRAVVLMCSLCHKISHGLDIVLPGEVVLPAASVAAMLWLKKEFDACFYDRQFLAKNCIGQLPNASFPSTVVSAQYLARRQRYPNGNGRRIGSGVAG